MCHEQTSINRGIRLGKEKRQYYFNELLNADRNSNNNVKILMIQYQQTRFVSVPSAAIEREMPRQGSRCAIVSRFGRLCP